MDHSRINIYSKPEQQLDNTDILVGDIIEIKLSENNVEKINKNNKKILERKNKKSKIWIKKKEK